MHACSAFETSLRRPPYAYHMQGTKVMDESHDQDTTDLHKCVSYIRDFAPTAEKSSVSYLQSYGSF